MIGMVLALLVAAADDPPASPPAPAAGPTPAAAPTTEDDGQKMVCKSIAVTGTRFPTRECRTKAQWEAMTAAARDLVNKSTSGVCTGSVCH